MVSTSFEFGGCKNVLQVLCSTVCWNDNFIVIEKIMNTDGDLDNTLLKREGYLAAQLRTLQPFGLNKRCEFRSKKRINFNVP